MVYRSLPLFLVLFAGCHVPSEEDCRARREPLCHPPCKAGVYGQDTDGDGIPDYRDPDMDGDGYAATPTERGDCDDCAPDVHPGAVEVADDGVDQDCDGADLVSGGGAE